MNRPPLVDAFGRTLTYLRLSLTDRCNLRCTYCRPADTSCEGYAQPLTDAQVVRIAGLLASLGIRKIRLTGGEPLLRPGLAALVSALHGLEGVEELALSTNGLRLAGEAGALKAAGLDRVNVSCDSLDAGRFRRITRGGDLADVWRGIDAAWTAGLRPVKVNCVMMRGVNDDEVEAFARLARTHPLHVRFIELMPLGVARAGFTERFLPLSEIEARCAALGPWLPEGTSGPCGPARSFRYVDGPGSVGFIRAVSSPFCGGCNRLRLTSDGWLRPCLDHASAVALGPALRAEAPDDVLESLIRRAVAIKPASHTMSLEGDRDAPFRTMCAVGG